MSLPRKSFCHSRISCLRKLAFVTAKQVRARRGDHTFQFHLLRKRPSFIQNICHIWSLFKKFLWGTIISSKSIIRTCLTYDAFAIRKCLKKKEEERKSAFWYPGTIVVLSRNFSSFKHLRAVFCKIGFFFPLIRRKSASEQIFTCKADGSGGWRM